MPKSDKATVRELLRDVCAAIDGGNAGMWKRTKNLKTLESFGWTEDDAYKVIYGLKFDNYREGPEIDREYPLGLPVWIFSCCCAWRDIYIKFSLDRDVSPPRLFVLSFHESD